MSNELNKEFKKIFDKVMEPAILIVEEVGNIVNKQKRDLISEFVKDLEELSEWMPELYRNLTEKWEKRRDEIL